MIDPRPYTYEYRKPRFNNPTFQSSSVYDSLYHMKIPSKNQILFTKPKEMIQQRKMQAFQEPVTKKPQNPEMLQLQSNRYFQQHQHNQRQIQRNLSLDHKNNKLPQISQRGQSLQRDISNRFINNDSQFSQRGNVNQARRVESYLSNYGQSLMKSETFDRFAIYQKQQKGYNIINCYPKSMSSSLRSFPKLTLQNKIIQNARHYKY